MSPLPLPRLIIPHHPIVRRRVLSLLWISKSCHRNACTCLRSRTINIFAKGLDGSLKMILNTVLTSAVAFHVHVMPGLLVSVIILSKNVDTLLYLLKSSKKSRQRVNCKCQSVSWRLQKQKIPRSSMR